MERLSLHIGKRLRAARRAAGYSSARLFAAAHNIPESTYSQHETGKRNLSVSMLLRYGELLQVNAGWLLTGEGIPYPDAKIKENPSSKEIDLTTCHAMANGVLDLVAPLFSEHNIPVADHRLRSFCLELCYCFMRLLSSANPK